MTFIEFIFVFSYPLQVHKSHSLFYLRFLNFHHRTFYIYCTFYLPCLISSFPKISITVLPIFPSSVCLLLCRFDEFFTIFLSENTGLLQRTYPLNPSSDVYTTYSQLSEHLTKYIGYYRILLHHNLVKVKTSVVQFAKL